MEKQKFNMWKISGSIALLGIVAILSGCSAKKADADSTSSESVDKPSSIVGTINKAIEGMGQDIDESAVQSKLTTLAAGDKCDEHATPLDAAGSQMSDSDGDYPQRVFYCKITKNTGSPDSIQGSYTLVKGISCALEQSGITFDGETRAVSLTLDTNCFTQTQLDNMGATTMTVNVTASKPAAFNIYYDAGVSLEVPSFGVFKMAVKMTDSKLEFASMEDQTSVSPNKYGAVSASFDKISGELRFESRQDRFQCAESGSCGWSRHDRIYAVLKQTNGEVTGVNSIEGMSSDIYDISGSTYYGKVSTIKGNLTDGVKARFYQNNAGSTSSNLADAAQYTEVSNSQCYVYGNDSASCGANTGVALPTSGSLPFTLHPSASATSVTSWFSALAGLSFSSVTSADTQ